MSSFLLDTRVFLTFLDDPSRLSPQVQAIFTQKGVKIAVSAVSFFEIAVKKALKKARVPDTLPEDATASGLAILPMTPEHAFKTVRLPYHHTDPYDRLLVAQAREEKMTLVTFNAVLQNYDVETLMA